MGKKTQLILSLLLAAVLLVSVSVGGWYWYDSHIDRSGWVEDSGRRFYQDFHGDPASGWHELEEGRFYFRDGGIPATGWLELEGSTYHFDPSGALDRGWKEVEGQTYHFEDSGAMTTGWLHLEKSSHYFGSDGIMAVGLLELEDGTYYLPHGTLAHSWQVIEGLTYYFDESGRMVRGDALVDGSEYHFQEDGVLRLGWYEFPEGRQYYQADGTPLSGLQQIDGKRYYFGEGGFAAAGWIQEGEYRYYFLEDGSAAVGPMDIDGQRYHFTPKGQEILLVNALNPIPQGYEPDLISVTDRHSISAVCYDALIQMLDGCTAAEIEYDFNSSYRTQEVQEAILEGNIEKYMMQEELDYDAAQEKALTFVAIPGTSEHQLGLAVDLLGDEAVAWFNQNCWDYGFIVRYTEEKESITGIIDEPWHFRYVGKDVARDLKETGLCLEEYLGAEPVKG